MRVAITVLLVVITVPGRAPASPFPGDSAAAGVRAVLMDQEAAWNSGDLQGYMAGYWQSDSLRFASGGRTTRGWNALMSRYERHYAGENRMGVLAFEDIEVMVLGPGAALAFGRWKVVAAEDKSGGLFTLLFRRIEENWRIVHDHTSTEKP